VTTRGGARIYRGAPRPRDEGACPGCGRTGISLTPTGRRRMHRDTDGSDCTSSGVLVTDRLPLVDVDPDAAAEAMAGRQSSGWGSLPDRDVAATGKTRMWSTPRRWSGKA
jgi:hypothetical protein